MSASPWSSNEWGEQSWGDNGINVTVGQTGWGEQSWGEATWGLGDQINTLSTSTGQIEIAIGQQINVTSQLLQANIGDAVGFTDIDVSVTGQSLQINIGEETPEGNAEVTPEGILLQSSTNSVDISANGNISVNVAEHTLQLSLEPIEITIAVDARRTIF